MIFKIGDKVVIIGGNPEFEGREAEVVGEGLHPRIRGYHPDFPKRESTWSGFNLRLLTNRKLNP